MFFYNPKFYDFFQANKTSSFIGRNNELAFTKITVNSLPDIQPKLQHQQLRRPSGCRRSVCPTRR